MSLLGGVFVAGALDGVTVTCLAGVAPLCFCVVPATFFDGAVAVCFAGVAAGLDGVAPGLGNVPVTRFGGVPAARLPFSLDGARSLVMRSVFPVWTELWTSPFQRLKSPAVTP